MLVNLISIERLRQNVLENKDICDALVDAKRMKDLMENHGPLFREKVGSVLSNSFDAVIGFYDALDSIFKLPMDELEAQSNSESDIVFENKGQEILYDASKAVYEARHLLAHTKSGLKMDGGSSDSVDPLISLVDTMHQFAEDYIRPVLSEEQVDLLDKDDDSTLFVKLEDRKAGLGIQNLVANVDD